jgi:hypothetical protein
VIEYAIEQHPDSPLMAGRHEPVEVGRRAEKRADAEVIDGVVAVRLPALSNLTRTVESPLLEPCLRLSTASKARAF